MSDVPIFFKGEARLLRWGDTATSGRTITLEIEEMGERHPFKGLRYGTSHGQRMKVAIVLVDDDEQPVAGPVTSKPAQSEGPRQDNNHPSRTVRAWRDIPRSQQAALSLQNQDFIQWLVSNYWKGQTDAHNPDLLLKDILGITSKKELDLVPEKAAVWDGVRVAYELRSYAR